MTSRKEVDKNLNFGYLDLLQITRFVLGTTELPSLHGIGWSSSAAVVQQRTARANRVLDSYSTTIYGFFAVLNFLTHARVTLQSNAWASVVC